MKKAFKTTLIITGTILGIILITSAALGLRLYSESKRFHPLPSGKPLPGVIVVRTGINNVYLLPNGDDTYIAIDGGSDPSNLRKGLKEVNINPTAITTVLCTHSDADHVGGITVFSKAQVIISKEEKQMVDGTTPRFFGIFHNTLNVPFATVNSEEKFSAGPHRVKGVLTPGHTPGSICWQVDNTLLFTGDALGINNGKAGLFSDLFNMNSKEQIASIARVAQLNGVQHVLSAHGGISTPAELFSDY